MTTVTTTTRIEEATRVYYALREAYNLLARKPFLTVEEEVVKQEVLAKCNEMEIEVNSLIANTDNDDNSDITDSGLFYAAVLLITVAPAVFVALSPSHTLTAKPLAIAIQGVIAVSLRKWARS